MAAERLFSFYVSANSQVRRKPFAHEIPGLTGSQARAAARERARRSIANGEPWVDESKQSADSTPSAMPMTQALPVALTARRGTYLSTRRIRLACGLVMFTYVTTHFINHSLGNISVGAMEKGLVVQKAIWQSIPGAIVLYVALFTHMGLGIFVLYQRRQFRWTRLEATQFVLGLTIPFLLADHFFGTRIALSEFGLEKGYAQELFKFWVASPGAGALQAVLLLIVWTHGCIGVHFWLALKPAYPRFRNLLLAAAVLLPTLALLGYFQGGRKVLIDAGDLAWRAQELTPAHVGTPDENNWLMAVHAE